MNLSYFPETLFSLTSCMGFALQVQISFSLFISSFSFNTSRKALVIFEISIQGHYFFNSFFFFSFKSMSQVPILSIWIETRERS